jgi:AcrR family transcriptional regulator
VTTPPAGIVSRAHIASRHNGKGTYGMVTRIQPGPRFTRKRVLIIRAAAHAFGRKGFHATRLEEIAADLNLTKASLYYYFSTKEELLFEVHLLSLQDVLDRMDRILATEKTPIAQLEAVITEHLRVLASDYEGAFLLQQEYELPENYRAEIVQLRDTYEHRLLEIIREGVRQRQFRVKNAKVTVRIILGAINWLLRWYRSEGSLKVEEIVEAYIDFFFYGILAPALPSSSSVGEIGDKRAVSAKQRRRSESSKRDSRRGGDA